MESVQTTQNQFTDEEKRLAEKYQVEPKLIRMIAEIVEEHFAEPEQTEQTEDVTEVQEQPAEQEEVVADKERLQNALANVLKPISFYNARFRHEVLTAALEQVSKVTKPADQLITMEKQVRNICDRLEPKTKAVIAVLGELMSLDGLTIGVDYGNELLFSTLAGKAHVDEARKQLPDDPDLAFLAKVYELAHSINEAE